MEELSIQFKVKLVPVTLVNVREVGDPGTVCAGAVKEIIEFAAGKADRLATGVLLKVAVFAAC